MFDEYKPKDLHEESTERNIDVPMRRRTIFVSLIVLVVIIVAITGGWYLIQIMIREHEETLASDFSLADLDGNTFLLSDFRGKVVVLDFMATWCGPCRQQIPHLKIVWENETYRDRIVLMSIDIDPTESEETLKIFAHGYPYATWIWARDTANLRQIYQVARIPKTVLIDQDGYVRFTHTGVTYAPTLIKEIGQLLGKNG